MSDPSHVWFVAVLPSPINCFFLRFECRQRVVGMILNDIVGNSTAFILALRTGLNEDDGHSNAPSSALLTLNL
jgi:hypothetical protein